MDIDSEPHRIAGQEPDDLIRSSGVAFGTSGARGLVDCFTDEVCAAYIHAFLIARFSHGSWVRAGQPLQDRHDKPSIPHAQLQRQHCRAR